MHYYVNISFISKVIFQKISLVKRMFYNKMNGALNLKLKMKKMYLKKLAK